MLVEQMKKDVMDARRAKDKNLLTFVSTLLAEVEKVGMATSKRVTTDEEAVKVIKKFISNAEDTIAHGVKAGKDVSASRFEIEVLNKYLPKQMSEADLKLAIEGIVSTIPDKTAKSATGTVMAQLKTMYGGQYDGKLASQLVKEALA